MRSNIEMLHDLITDNIKVDSFKVTIPTSTVRKHDQSEFARWFGTELERCISKMIFDLNQENSYYKGTIRINSFPYLITNNAFKLGVYLRRNEAITKNYSIADFIKNYKLPYKNCYGITDGSQQKQFVYELKTALGKIDFQKFISNQLYIPGLTIYQELTDKIVGMGTIDMIIDNKIIDIKSDTKINKTNKKYLAQLLFYYFMLQSASKINFSNKDFTELSRIKIDTIALYYARYDRLFSFKISELIENESKIQDYFDAEVEYGNPLLRELIDFSIIKRNKCDMKEIKKEVKNRRFKTLKDHLLELIIKRDFENARNTKQVLLDEGFDEEFNFLQGLLSFSENDLLWTQIYLRKNWSEALKSLRSIQQLSKSRLTSLKIKIDESLKLAHPYNIKNFGEELKDYSNLTLFISSLDSLELFINYNKLAIAHEQMGKKKIAH